MATVSPTIDRNTSAASPKAGRTTIWLDGQWLDRETATVSVFDHGLLYGDGVFEGIRVYGGKIFKLEEHIDRLYDSAQALWLTVPMSKADMIAVTEEGVRRSGLQDAYIRHIVTRGVGDLGLDPRKCVKPTVIIITDTIALWPAQVYETGLRVVTAGTPIPHRESLSPRVKSLNYLPHIMAKAEGIQAGADDVLMLDATGHVAEASGCNIFVVKGRTIRTPPAYAGILKGVTRDVIIELAREAGFDVQETLLNRYDVYTADEVFFTGTAAEVVGIREVDGRRIGAGKPGPITHDIAARFRALTRA
ncbi:MAG TPA: branched-chain-amino-acid transaminase [Gemmatimonadales bacterium]|nr:branched-chain-amino-acid transaminase [Gemmatimonadales bacterium]